MEQNDITKMLHAFGELWDKKFSAEIADKLKPQCMPDPYESTQINEIAAALAKAQGEFPTIEHNRDNAFFKSSYADLHALVKAVKPVLSKNGICFTQTTHIATTGEIILHTRIIHSSGQWMETRSRIIPEKGDIQSYGRAVSYHKRYALMGLLGITASGDTNDDDAEGIMEKHRANMSTDAIKYNPQKQSATTITKEQLEELEEELDGFPEIAEELLIKQKIEELCDLPKNVFNHVRQRILEKKATYTNPVRK